MVNYQLEDDENKYKLKKFIEHHSTNVNNVIEANDLAIKFEVSMRVGGGDGEEVMGRRSINISH